MNQSILWLLYSSWSGVSGFVHQIDISPILYYILDDVPSRLKQYNNTIIQNNTKHTIQKFVVLKQYNKEFIKKKGYKYDHKNKCYKDFLYYLHKYKRYAKNRYGIIYSNQYNDEYYVHEVRKRKDLWSV